MREGRGGRSWARGVFQQPVRDAPVQGVSDLSSVLAAWSGRNGLSVQGRPEYAPCARDHYFGFGHHSQRILQNGQTSEVQFMAMLWVQDSIKIQKQLGRGDYSIAAFQQRLNFWRG